MNPCLPMHKVLSGSHHTAEEKQAVSRQQGLRFASKLPPFCVLYFFSYSVHPGVCLKGSGGEARKNPGD